MNELGDLLGSSPGMRAVRERIARLLDRRQDARRLPPILIQGETGTGKGLLARIIHRAGPRPAGAFVDVNCAAIPEALLEAEMFGFERGAFTDARRSKPGLLQTAHRGTIFLDEVGLLPEALQVKLLKVLEDRAVRRLGSTRDEPIDVWIISATNEDLQAAIRQRRFREDLYHRLAVLTVTLPPLRERGEDVLLLAEYFLARTSGDYGMTGKAFSVDARAALLAHPWHGNVRELSNVIERAVLLSTSAEVTAEMLALDHRTPSTRPATPAAPTSLDDAVRARLVEALGQTGWNISRTAMLLNISRNTLRARMERYGLRDREAGPRSERPAPAPATGPAAPAPPGPSVTRRWEQRRVAMLRVALVSPGEPDVSLETARALDVVVDKMRTFGGRVEGISPTGALAVFGLETPDDAASRAAHAALAIVKAAERGRRDETNETRSRLGIHAASVLISVADGASEVSMDERRMLWSVLGDLIERAPLDGIAVSASTAPLLRRRFEVSRRSGPAGDATHLLVGHERTGLGLGGHTGEFVGRRDELELLESRLATAVRGQGQVVGIAGEAGIGKSRLAFEFRQRLAERDIGYLEAHCHGYGVNVPYLPVVELLRTTCGITEVDTPEANRAKVEACLARVGLDPAAGAPYLLQLLGVKAGAETLADEPPEAVKSRLIDTLRQLTLRLSRMRPAVIVLDDLQWIDKASEEYLASLAEILGGSPILLIATYRPGYQQPWIRKSYATQIALQPLDSAEARRVVDAVLGDREVPAPLVDAMVDKAEGNAFFLEEMARAAREATEPGAPLVVPDTVQDVLLSRIERLAPEERLLLTSAAVIGKDFARTILEAIAELPADQVRRTLLQLEAAEFVHETGGIVDGEYTFKHALTHEVAYGCLTGAERRRLHRLILRALEELHADRLGEHLGSLTHHAAAGAVWDRASRYLRQAGAKAYGGGAYRDAVACFEQALGALAELPPGRQRDEQIVDLKFDLRTSLLPLGEHGRIYHYLREAEETAADLRDRSRLGRACTYLTNYFFLNGDQDRALAYGRRALDIATELGDFALEAEANLRLGQVHHALGDFRAAAQILSGPVHAMTGDLQYERFGLPLLFSVGCRNWLVRSLVELGEFDDGLRLALDALQIAETANEPFSLTVACWTLGHLHLRRGEVGSAIHPLERGLALCRQGAISVWFPRLASALGVALALSGRAAEALALLEQGIEQVARGSAGDRSMALLSLSEGHLLAERGDRARAFAESALELSQGQRDRGTEAWAHRLCGEILAELDDRVEAEAALRRALGLADELGMRPLAAHCHFALARLGAGGGRASEAAEHLDAARRIYAERRMGLWLAKSARPDWLEEPT